MNQEVLEQVPSGKAAQRAIALSPFVITFSGIDGAGKTTQITRVSSWLQKHGLRVLGLSFWEHVAVWSKMRSRVGPRVMDSRQADRMAEPLFAPRNNKHIRKWYLTAARSGFYMLDVVRLRRLLASQDLRNYDVVIFDRYVYDQVANVYSGSFAARAYGKILLQHTPPPDLAFILDAAPAAAFTRKPEYPLEFMYRNRLDFLHLRQLDPRLIVISGVSAEDVETEICRHITRSRLLECTSPTGNTEVAPKGALVPLQSFCTAPNKPTATV